MKTTNLIWILVLLSFLLAVSGCGEKEAEPEQVPAEEELFGEVEEETTEEPELPEEGVQEEGIDITEELVAPEEEEEEETEEEAEEEETEEEKQTAQNYRVISLKDLNAYPTEMNIKVGTTVEWRNVNDQLQHIIGWRGQTQAGIKPEPILAGESWSYTFTEPGEIVWFSTARPTVQGTIYIEE